MPADSPSRQAVRLFFRALLRALPISAGPPPELFDLFGVLQKSKHTIDEKITRATESLREASRLVDELELVLKERTEKLELLRSEVERYSKLAEVEEGKAKALLAQLELTLKKGQNFERWVSFGINIAAGLLLFVIGVVLSPMLTDKWNRWTSPNKESASPITPSINQMGHHDARAKEWLLPTSAAGQPLPPAGPSTGNEDAGTAAAGQSSSDSSPPDLRADGPVNKARKRQGKK